MPFSHIEIEEEKKLTIGLIFLILVCFYFLTAWILGNVFKFFAYIRFHPHFACPYLDFTETIGVLAIALLGATIHWCISIEDAASKMLNALNAQPLDLKDTYHQRLQNIVEEVRVATGGQEVRCVVIPTTSMNAFSIMDFERKPIIGVTEGLLSKLKRHQLEVVVGHEMAHIVSGDCLMTTISSTLFSLYSEILKGISRMVKETGEMEGRGVIILILVYIVLSICQCMSWMMRMAISRQREYRADAVAVRLTRNPLGLAEALYAISRNYRTVIGEDLSSIFIMNPKFSLFDESEGFWANLFSTHPPIKKRLEILLSMAHTDLETLKEEMESKKGIQIRRDTVTTLPPKVSPKESWFVVNEENGKWVGPFSLLELSGLKWFRPDSWVREETGEKITLAHENKRLREMFKGHLGGKNISNFLCPHCKIELVEIMYEGAPIWRCNYCQGVFAESSKVKRILVRRDQALSDEIGKLAKLYTLATRKINGVEKPDEMKPKFSLHCPSCRTQMKRSPYSLAYLVEIDSCPQCNYIWFDKNELEVLQYLIEESA